jgi:hypothetical protein
VAISSCSFHSLFCTHSNHSINAYAMRQLNRQIFHST